MDIIATFFIVVQILIGYNLILPFIFLLWWFCTRNKAEKAQVKPPLEADFAIIVTAYQHTSMLKSVVNSILSLNYNNYQIYIVADNCSADKLEFNDSRVLVLRPATILASNTKSHLYAVNNFIRPHECITILDSDNLVHKEFLKELNLNFNNGYSAVQGFRAPKNLHTTIACLDAARDLYYHFYDGKLLFELGSSATLSGSGMAFTTSVYQRFLYEVEVSGAGFDKVLQAWLVSNNYRIAFNAQAIVYDEKTSKPEQLVQQRSRWINSWFKYARLGMLILMGGIKGLNRNRILFGVVLVRPPLFIFLALSVFAMLINLTAANYSGALIWLIGLLVFVLSFYIALRTSKADGRIFSALTNIPRFMYYQFVSLINARKANKISVSTKHDLNDSSF